MGMVGLHLLILGTLAFPHLNLALTSSCSEGCVCSSKVLICLGWKYETPPHVSDTDDYESLDLSSDGGIESLESDCTDSISLQASARARDARPWEAGGGRALGEALEAGRLPASWLGSGRFAWLLRLRLRGVRLRLVHKDAFRFQLKLKCVDLSANNLARLNVFTWERHKDLNTLLLSGNKGLEIPVDAPLLYSRTLQVLHLSACDLTSLHISAFEGMPRLKKLNLSNNILTTISALSSLPPRIENVDLRSNKMSFLDIALAKTMIRIPQVLTSNNPWKCDCDLKNTWKWIRNFEDSSNTKASFQITCSFFNQTWDEVFENTECKSSIPSAMIVTTSTSEFPSTRLSDVVIEVIQVGGTSLETNDSDHCVAVLIVTLVVQVVVLIILIITFVMFKKKETPSDFSESHELKPLRNQ